MIWLGARLHKTLWLQVLGLLTLSLPALCLIMVSTALAASRLDGPTPLPLSGEQTPQRLTFERLPWPIGADDELVIEGHNPAAGPQTLILRVDDAASVNYRSRVNLERIIPPGPFTLRFSLSDWRTAQPRALALDQLTRLYLFMADGAAPLTLTRWYWSPGLTLPAGTIALDLGASDAPRFTGFEPLAPGDPRLLGHPSPILRPSGDALIRDGLRNLDGVRLEVPKGRYQLTLWLDDPGEWEYLPHPLERSVLIDGEPVWAERLQPANGWPSAISPASSRRRCPIQTPGCCLVPARGGRSAWCSSTRAARSPSPWGAIRRMQNSSPACCWSPIRRRTSRLTPRLTLTRWPKPPDGCWPSSASSLRKSGPWPPIRRQNPPLVSP
ncbi:hypothetical protein ACSZOJ_12650 [Aeromonas dhakensis]